MRVYNAPKTHHARVQIRSFHERFLSWLQMQLVLRPVVACRGEGRAFEYLKQLQVQQFQTPEEIGARQQGRLQEIIEYARTRTRFYRQRFPSQGEPASQYLERLPFLTKAELQGSLQRLEASPLPLRTTLKTTGGSTGQAVTVRKDRDAMAREMAATWLAYGWNGVAPGDKSARFWGAPTTIKRRVRAKLVELAVRRVNYSAFAFTEKDLERYWRDCWKRRPAFIYGYVSMLEAFASYVQRQGYDGVSLGLKSVITTSEVLGEPQRRLLKAVFGVPVQNEYGCGEVGPVAYECEQGLLHVMVENLYVELIKEDGTRAGRGESGEVVVTDLNNRATPLIRYRLGDFATWADGCACGRGWPAFARVWGRAYDFVEAPGGRRYHGEFFMYLFEDLKEKHSEIRQFQVVQVASDTLEVRLVTEKYSQALESAICKILARRIPEMKVRVTKVGSIERTASGKLRLIRNDWVVRSSD